MTRLVATNSGPSRVSLILLGSIAFMVIADMRVIDPMLRIIADDFDVHVGQAAMIISAYTIPYGLFQLMYGPLGDRVGKLNVMSKAIAIFGAGTALCAIAPNFSLLVSLRFLTGMFAAAIIPLSLAYIGDNFPYAERQTAIGRYLSALMLGQILSSSVGGIFAEYLSWREVFLLFGLASLVIALVFWQATRSLPDPHAPVQSMTGFQALRPYWQLLKQPAARVVLTAVFIEGFFLFGGFAYIGAFVRDRHTLPYVMIGLLLSGFGMGGLIYSISVKRLVRWLGEQGLVLYGGGLVGVCYLAITLSPWWIVLVPGTILIGLGFYMLHSTLQTRATELSPESRGMAVSLFAFHLFVGQGVGAAVLGQVVDRLGYVICFTLSASAVIFLAIWLAHQLRLYPCHKGIA